MRSTASYGAVIATSLLRLVNADVASEAPGYGNSPADSDGNSNGIPGDGSNGQSTLAPGGGSGSLSGVPNNSPDTPTCPFGDSTTTVFVTVHPSHSGQFPGNSQSSIAAVTTAMHTAPDSSDSPELSQHSLPTGSPVQQFTTITIDIWGDSPSGSGSGSGSDSDSGSDSESSSGSGSGSGPGSGPGMSTALSAPAYTDSSPNTISFSKAGETATAQNPSDSGEDGFPGGIPSGSGANGQGSPTYSSTAKGAGGPPSYSGKSGPGQQVSSANGVPSAPGSNSGAGLPWTTVVTNVDIDWTTGPGGLSQVTVFSPATITFGGVPTAATESRDHPDWPITQSIPVYQSTSDLKATTLTGSDGQLTIIGSDGTSTVLGPFNSATGGSGDSTLNPSNGGGFPFPGITLSDTNTDGSVHTDITPASGIAGSATTTCATIVTLGPDGLPTTVETTWVVPATAPPSGATDNLPGSASPQPSFSGIQIPPVSGATGAATAAYPQTTCIRFTSIGADGLPTVVESTYVISATQSVLGVTTGASVPVITDTPIGLPTGIPGGDSGHVQTTCVSYTVTGPDGSPTIVEATYTLQQPVTTVSELPWVTSGASSGRFPNGASGQHFTTLSGVTLPGNKIGDATAVETCFTVLGSDGQPTVVDVTVVAPSQQNTQSNLQGFPSSASSLLATEFPAPITPGAAITTETSITILGSDGHLTVVDTTVILPAPAATQATSSEPASGENSASWLTPGVPFTGFPSPTGASGSDGSTTCTSFTIIGADGLPTVVETTWTLEPTDGTPAVTSIQLPPFMSGGPSQFPGGTPPYDAVTTATTLIVIGPDGIPTPVVETIVVPSDAISASDVLATTAGLPAPPPSISAVDVTPQNTLASGIPTLSAYGDIGAFPGPANEGSAVNSGGGIIAISSFLATFVSGTVTGTYTFTTTVTVPSDGVPVVSASSGRPLSAYGDFPGADQPSSAVGGVMASETTLWPSAVYGTPGIPQTPAGNSPCPTTTLQESTWTDVIAEETTTYTFDFPLTTLATVRAPLAAGRKRAIKRQANPLSPAPWSNSSSTVSVLFSENTSLGASLTSALGEQQSPPVSPVGPSLTPGIPAPAPTLCPSGGEIGNSTVTFDDINPGPLFNPADDLWFSEGFLVTPPSSQALQPYVPTSGGNLVEFVPPALSSPGLPGSGDTAQIGVGRNLANSCFRFDFYGANLGCAAQGSEQWCEFDISAYTYDESTGQQESIAWSETKRVPACASFPNGPCSLTPVEFDGYTNITSVLITLRVGLDLRVWWADDFRFGWTDNSCEAASCRAGQPTLPVKRQTVESALRRGIWHWTPTGLNRLSDEYIWEAIH